MRHTCVVLLLTALLPATAQAWSWRESRAVNNAVRSAVKVARTKQYAAGETAIVATVGILQPSLQVKHMKRLMGELRSSESQLAVAVSFVARPDVTMNQAIAVSGEVRSFWHPHYVSLQSSIAGRERHIAKLQRKAEWSYYKPTLAVGSMRASNKRDQAEVDGYRETKNRAQGAARDAILVTWAHGRTLSSQALMKLAGSASTDAVRKRFEQQAADYQKPFLK